MVAGKISVYYTANATAEIYWDPLVYEECDTNTTEIVYEVSVSTQGGELPEGALNIEDESSAIVSDLQPNQEYSVLVDAIIFIGNNTCFTTKYPPMSLMIPSNHSQMYSGKYCVIVDHALCTIIQKMLLLLPFPHFPKVSIYICG